MSSVQRIRIGAKSPSAADVLEYARELIAQYGWNPGSRVPEGGTEPVMAPSGEEGGFTLHDAIGEACTRLSAVTDRASRKDWSITTTEGEMKNLRAEATALVVAELPGDVMNDYSFNDQAASVDDVYAVIDAALAKAQEGADGG